MATNLNIIEGRFFNTVTLEDPSQKIENLENGEKQITRYAKLVGIAFTNSLVVWFLSLLGLIKTATYKTLYEVTEKNGSTSTGIYDFPVHIFRPSLNASRLEDFKVTQLVTHFPNSDPITRDVAIQCPPPNPPSTYF